jgi:hypothetical protein
MPQDQEEITGKERRILDSPIYPVAKEIKEFLTWDEYNIDDRIKKYDSYLSELVEEYHMELGELHYMENVFEDWMQSSVREAIENGGAPTARAAEERVKKTAKYKEIARNIQKTQDYVNYLKDGISSVKNFSFTISRQVERKRQREGI